MLVSEIIGKEVLDKSANRLGKIVDIDVDLPKGMVEAIVVKVGVTKKLNVKVSNIVTTGDRVILNVSKEELESPPVEPRKTISLL